MHSSKLASYLAWGLVALQLHHVSVLAIALPNSPKQSTNKDTGFSSTKLCEGDKLNEALLRSFTPENPPSLALLSTCDKILNLKNNADLNGPRPFETPQCFKYREAPFVDTYVCMLYIYIIQTQPVIYYIDNARCGIAYEWGNARVEYCSRNTPTRAKAWAREVYINALKIYNSCAVYRPAEARWMISGYISGPGEFNDLEVLIFRPR